MRTTITLDDEAAALIRKDMRERGIGFKQAVNDAIKRGFEPRRRISFRTPTFDMGPALFPLEKALQYAGELEDEEILHKMRMGK